ncbi:ZIP family metal transporter [uncultured Ilyobacter sp.]|uniref:ZIP family metal transporter n=1 Tax=uncultured Ilyobacter sp. TaxID=544433 RepID=UPI0029F59C02|nr:ZIP family metal transporter [uncultured Ilyobacter sp.]
MENTFWIGFFWSLFATIVTSAGIYTIRKFADWGKNNTTYFICFAVGVLISSSFLHIIPKSFSMNPQAPKYLLGGFFGLYMFNRFLTAFVCEKDPEKLDYNIGLITILGIGLHSFIDGFIYSVSFTVSIFTGFLATTGMVLHEFPEGIITYLVLIKSGFSERSSFLMSFLAAALTTPLGMLVSYPLISRINQSKLGALLALSGGALIYVGATHLLPKAEEEHKKFSLIVLATGILVAIVIILSKT